MSVYLIQPLELVGTNHYVLGTELFRRAGTRVVVLMECSDPEKGIRLIRSKFQERYTVKDDHVEGDAKELRNLFYETVLMYEQSLPVKMDLDEPTIVKYLK